MKYATTLSTLIILLLVQAALLPASAENGVSGKSLESMGRNIRKCWFPPKGSQPCPVTARFALDSKGRLLWIEVVKPSGIALMDESAIRALQDTAPFPPLPLGSPPKVVLEIRFDYNVFTPPYRSVTIVSESSVLSPERPAWSMPDHVARADFDKAFASGLEAANRPHYYEAELAFQKAAELDVNSLEAKVNVLICRYAGSPYREMTYESPLYRVWGPAEWEGHSQKLANLKSIMMKNSNDAGAKLRFDEAVRSLLLKLN